MFLINKVSGSRSTPREDDTAEPDMDFAYTAPADKSKSIRKQSRMRASFFGGAARRKSMDLGPDADDFKNPARTATFEVETGNTPSIHSSRTSRLRKMASKNSLASISTNTGSDGDSIRSRIFQTNVASAGSDGDSIRSRIFPDNLFRVAPPQQTMSSAPFDPWQTSTILTAM